MDKSGNSNFEVPFLSNIGLVMTHKCQIACPHCIIEAGPHRKEELSINDAFHWIDQISDYRSGHAQILSLTGGEPFYDINALREISNYALQRHLLVSVVTNAFWAQSKREAIRVLRSLPSIKILAFSTDSQHLQFIPVENIKNAIFAARECQIPFNVYLCTENESLPEHKNLLKLLYEITAPDTIKTTLLLPFGRANARSWDICGSKYEMTDIPSPSACIAASSPIIFHDGRITACVGAVIGMPVMNNNPLELGNIGQESLHHILDMAEENAVLHAIRIWGPSEFIPVLNEAGLSNSLPVKYPKGIVCGTCASLMANPEIRQYLSAMNQDREFKTKIAYARVHYFGETKMAEICGLV